MKKILALSASVVMLLSFTLQAEAGFNLGGIANKIAGCGQRDEFRQQAEERARHD